MAVPAMLLAGLSACGTHNSKAPQADSTKANADSLAAAPQVVITDTNHHVYFRPVAGSAYRFHVADRITQTMGDAQAGHTNSRSGITTTDYYIRETIRAVSPDSIVTAVFHIDSISATISHDTTKANYSSERPSDRRNPDFLEFNMIVGKDFTATLSKYGDINSFPDVSQLTEALMATAPDSLKKNKQVLANATRQATMVANSYVMRILSQVPVSKIVADTTWSHQSQLNIDLVPGVSLPVTVKASEKVAGLEQRGTKRVVVLEAQTTTTPGKTSFEEGNVKANLDKFIATSNSTMRLEDATGVLFHRTLKEVRQVDFTITSKQTPTMKRTLTQMSTEEMLVAQLP